MAEQCPLCLSKEGMCFDVGSSSARAKTFKLVFYQKFSYQGFAETIEWSAVGTVRMCTSYFDI